MEYTKIKDIPGMLIGLDFEKGFDSLEWPFMYATLNKFGFSDYFVSIVRLLYKNASSTVINNGTTSGYFQKDIPGMLIGLDFEKGFDSLEWPFMYATLNKFGFSDYFVSIVRLLYKNASSTVINNGTTSGYFQVKRGVRQGNPLSPYLFLFSIEILGQKIRVNQDIKGFQLGSEELKILQYADDTVGTVDGPRSARKFLYLVEEFGEYSGLKLNRDKSEGYWIGKERGSKKQPLNICWPEKGIKILGVFCSYQLDECNKVNFYDKLKFIKNTISRWQMRNLTMIGRIHIIKTFILSKFQYNWSNDSVPKQFIKLLNRIIFKFIWNGKREKIKRTTLIKNVQNGGLNAPDIEAIILTARVSWIKRYLFTDDRPWKYLWDYRLSIMGYDPRLCLLSNVVSVADGDFYKEIIKSAIILRAEYFRNMPVNSQLLWQNDNVKINKTTIC